MLPEDASAESAVSFFREPGEYAHAYNDEPAVLLKGRVGVVSHVHISEPMLATVRSRALHWELAEVLRKGNYDGYVSIEMGRTDDLSQLFAAMEYVTELFRPNKM